MPRDKMEILSTNTAGQKALRLWPGVVIVLLQWLIRFVVPVFVPEAAVVGVFAGLLGGLAVMLWWAFFSRAPRAERWGAIVLMILTMVATSRFLHISIATGMMGMIFVIYAIPGLSLAFVVWALTSRGLPKLARRATMVATILIACAVWTLVQTGGFDTDGKHDFAWRWAETPEERLLAQAEDESMALPPTPDATETGPATGAGWPGFRGPNRDGIIRGLRIKTDWSASPPVELWRRPIGPAWSSFAVRGKLFYTQEQRGDHEVVSCYTLSSGEPVWRHRDPARFWESNGGAGPRGTPTLSNGRVYTFGGTGILNVLDARDGSVLWSRNAALDTKTKVPTWGLSSSPLIVDDLVIVAVIGKLVAYDLATGDPRWFGADGGDGYSSPHLLTIDGVAQILLMSKAGATSIAPTDGTLLWEHPWPGGTRIVQPALCGPGALLLSAGDGKGARRIGVAQERDGWKVEERWSSVKMKPYFNDFIVHDGHIYGLNSRSLVCIDVEDGQRKWKGARYGGQLILLADQGLLLILSEKGELALVEATADQFTELARFPAIKGKTWNHPVLVDDILLVRNAQEMAAFRLPLAVGI
jgi:outer membrane protein assembly factor BamB